MQIYKTQTNPLLGTKFRNLHKKALLLFNEIKNKSKRRPYIRSAYFKKDKVFISLFWQHLYQKPYPDQMRRIKLYPCALELIQNSHIKPESKENPNRKSEILYRFAGQTKNLEMFFIQIKEDKNSGEKFLISVFPSDKKKTLN